MTQDLADDGLPALRHVIETHGLAAKKSLGQNFLFDLNLTRRIARAAAPLADATIVEVGPGPGGLTRALLAEGASKVIAIERDTRALPALAEIAAHYPGRLDVIEADALHIDWTKLAKGPLRIVANLPYNIGTPLLLGWLTQKNWPPFYDSLTLMFQKEVALRIAAAPGSKDYGRLSVISQWRCACKKLFDVNRSAFTPPPKITSSIVQLIPLQQPAIPCSVTALEKVTAAAFGQRRKMLRSSLKTIFSEPEEVLAKLNIAETRRAEEISVDDFARLALQLSAGSEP
jgi:16S rRNA (adenine1518-N6/adenine1519-N6)-dimethyltransferase